MASNRDLERILARAGCSASRLDVVNRQLREKGLLSNAGRGLHAPQTTSSEAAIMLLAYAGAAKAVRAYDRTRRLEGLTSPNDPRTLLAVVRDLLEGSEEISELRISRVRSQARLVRSDNSIVTFTRSKTAPSVGRFENEAVLDGTFFSAVAALLRGETADIAVADDAEDPE